MQQFRTQNPTGATLILPQGAISSPLFATGYRNPRMFLSLTVPLIGAPWEVWCTFQGGSLTKLAEGTATVQPLFEAFPVPWSLFPSDPRSGGWLEIRNVGVDGDLSVFYSIFEAGVQ